jgi:enolase-phosphatase E1
VNEEESEDPSQGKQNESAMTIVTPRSCSHLLLDIEGTTCPVDYVSGTLFPYAAKALEEFLRTHGQEPGVVTLIDQIRKAWDEDPHEEARVLHEQHAREGSPCTPYILWLIREDRKLTPLKSLQGKIWNLGYKTGDLRAPLFDDISPALHRIKQQGVTLCSYSSGSIEAQRLLYQYSNAGDLTPLFSHWFDTTTGPKGEASSYATISDALNTDPPLITFISDAKAELQAAKASGMNCIFSERPGNPETGSQSFPILKAWDNLLLP